MMHGNLMAIQASHIQQKISVKFFYVIATPILFSMDPNLLFVRIYTVVRQVVRDFFSPAQHYLEVTVEMEGGVMEDRV